MQFSYARCIIKLKMLMSLLKKKKKKIENVENFGHMESESLSPIFVPQNTDKNKEAKVVVL